MTNKAPPPIAEVKDPALALQFILGGNARFTLKSKATQNRVTYKVMVADDKPDFFFVYYLTGSDNENDYTYLGMIRPNEQGKPTLNLTKKSKLRGDSLPFKALHWSLYFLSRNMGLAKMPGNLEFWHEGRCCRCGRTLTVPESIESGIGPECAKRRLEGNAAA